MIEPEFNSGFKVGFAAIASALVLITILADTLNMPFLGLIIFITLIITGLAAFLSSFCKD